MKCEPCACGGEIWADPSNDDSVHVAVAAHNYELLHQLWRQRGGFLTPTFQVPERYIKPGWTWGQMYDAYERRRVG